MTKKSLFRQEALDKLSSPEQLDKLLKVTNPVAWLALLAASILTISALCWSFLGSLAVEVSGPGVLLPYGGIRSVPALDSGVITEVLARPGQVFQDGTVIARMKPAQETSNAARIEIITDQGGQVTETIVSNGQFVNQGETVALLVDPGAELECVAYFAFNQGDKVEAGMSVRATLSSVNQDVYGSLIGEVVSVSPYPTTRSEMQAVLADEQLVDFFLAAGDTYQQAPLEIRIRLKRDLDDPSGYAWTSGKGPSRALRGGTACQLQVVTEYLRPAELAIPKIRDFLGAKVGE